MWPPRLAPARCGAMVAPMHPRLPVPRFSRRWARVLIPAAMLAVLLGGGALALAESDTVRSVGDGVWWSLSLVTTVGFVGRSPATEAGKAISAVLMVMGFLLMTMTTGAIASLFVREDEAPGDAREASFEQEALAELRALRAEVAELRDRVDRGGGGTSAG